MKDEIEIELAWKIFHLISQLNELIWDYYEDEFIKKHRQNTHVLYRGSLDDYMRRDDLKF
jgi:hypothetical protein